MKILLITPEFPPHHTGGGWVVFENLAKTYKKLWHDVLVISGDHTIKNIFTSIISQQESWIDIVRIPEIYTPTSLLNTVMPIPIWYQWKLARIIREFAPDFTHIHGYGLFMPAQLARICRDLDIAYTFTIHGAPVSPAKMWNFIISLAYRFYHRYYGFPMLDGANRLTAVSSFARDFDIFTKWKSKIEIIGNGIDPDEYSDPGYDIYKQRWIRKGKNTKIILSLGRIEWIKWFEKIIEKIPEMVKAGYDIRYVIAWRDNGYQKQLEEIAKSLWAMERIFFLGYIDGLDKMSALFHCETIAIPSITETFSIVALEARLLNKPAITTFSGWLVTAFAWYDRVYSLEEWKKSFLESSSGSDNIDVYSWDSIANGYLLNL